MTLKLCSDYNALLYITDAEIAVNWEFPYVGGTVIVTSEGLCTVCTNHYEIKSVTVMSPEMTWLTKSKDILIHLQPYGKICVTHFVLFEILETSQGCNLYPCCLSNIFALICFSFRQTTQDAPEEVRNRDFRRELEERERAAAREKNRDRPTRGTNTTPRHLFPEIRSMTVFISCSNWN